MARYTAVIAGRDWLINSLARVDSDDILNDGTAVNEASFAGVELAISLRRLMSRLKAEAFAGDGNSVDYKRLRESAVYAEYRAYARQLRMFEPQALTSS